MRFSKWIITIIIFALTVVSGWAKPNPYHIAVAADGGSPSAVVSAVAGRAQYFLFFDENGKFSSALKNPYLMTQGAGPRVAVLLSEKGVKIFMASTFGGNMGNFMSAKGIALKTFSGSAADAAKSVAVK